MSAININKNNFQNEIMDSEKTVLLDFWASWCAPCRKENPNMVKTYEKFKDKGLVIIGISMDAREGDWKKAVETDGLTWIQACDYKNTAGEVARAYNITAIPRVLVLDKNNRVIADGLTGEMLDEFLQTVELKFLR